MANFLTSFFACEVEGEESSGIKTFARGVAGRGTFDAFRDGVNETDVAVKRVGGFDGPSSRSGCGTGRGGKPGGTDGVEDRDNGLMASDIP